MRLRQMRHFDLEEKKEKEMRQKSEGGDGNLKKVMKRSEGDRHERQQKNMTNV